MDHSHPSTRAYVSLRCSMIVMTKGNRGSSGSQMPRQFAAVESRHMAQRNRCLIGHHHSFTYTRHTNARDRTLARSLARSLAQTNTHSSIHNIPGSTVPAEHTSTRSYVPVHRVDPPAALSQNACKALYDELCNNSVRGEKNNPFVGMNMRTMAPCAWLAVAAAFACAGDGPATRAPCPSVDVLRARGRVPHGPHRLLALRGGGVGGACTIPCRRRSVVMRARRYQQACP
jgi:hypothetical protein